MIATWVTGTIVGISFWSGVIVWATTFMAFEVFSDPSTLLPKIWTVFTIALIGLVASVAALFWKAFSR